MSNTAPLVSEEGGAYQSANASEGDLYEKQPCGLKKYKKSETKASLATASDKALRGRVEQLRPAQLRATAFV